MATPTTDTAAPVAEALAYWRGQLIVFEPLMSERAALSLPAPYPFQHLDANADSHALGAALLSSLDESLRFPKDESHGLVYKRLLAVFRVRSWKQFSAGTRVCLIERTASTLRCYPSAPGRSRSFQWLDPVVDVELGASPHEVAAALLRTFHACTPGVFA